MRKVPACTLAVIAAAALSACGGGDDTVTPQSAVKVTDFSAYAGTWATCGTDGSATSVLQQVVITQASADRFHYRWLETTHASADCSGPGSLDDEEQADVVAQGKTTTVDGIVVQLVASQVTRDGAVVNEDQVVLLTADGLRIGDAAAKEPDGTMHLVPSTFKPAQFVEPVAAVTPPPPAPPPPAVAPPPPPPVTEPEPVQAASGNDLTPSS